MSKSIQWLKNTKSGYKDIKQSAEGFAYDVLHLAKDNIPLLRKDLLTLGYKGKTLDMLLDFYKD